MSTQVKEHMRLSTTKLAKQISKRVGIHHEAVYQILLESFSAIREYLDSQAECTLLVTKLGVLVKKEFRNKVLYDFKHKRTFRKTIPWIRLVLTERGTNGHIILPGGTETPTPERVVEPSDQTETEEVTS